MRLVFVEIQIWEQHRLWEKPSDAMMRRYGAMRNLISCFVLACMLRLFKRGKYRVVVRELWFIFRPSKACDILVSIYFNYDLFVALEKPVMSYFRFISQHLKYDLAVMHEMWMKNNELFSLLLVIFSCFIITFHCVCVWCRKIVVLMHSQSDN